MKRFLLHSVITLLLVPGAYASEIHQLAEAGDLPGIKSLLNENPTLLEDRDDGNYTPLLTAALNGHTEVVAYLLEKDTDMTATNTRGSTPLHLAAYNGHTQVADLLLKKGIDINARSHSGFTPLLYACYMGHAEVAELLIDKGADMTAIDSTWGGLTIHWACSRGSDEVRKTLLARGVDLRTETPTDSSTPIFWAAFSGNVDALRFLIDNGVSAASTEHDGWTPLHNAARNGHLEAVLFLLEQGADINAASNEGQSALAAATESGQEEMAEKLIELGADIHTVDSSNMSLLHWAAIGNSLRLVELCLKKGIDVNQTDEWGTTALDRATFTRNIDMVRLLMENGANVNVISEDGNTALKNAIIQGNDSIIELLVIHNADPNIKENHYGRTCLHWAAIKGYTYAVEQVISHNALINAADSKGKLPLYYANKYGHTDVAALLKEHGAETEGIKNDYVNPANLMKNVKPGDAVIWYLGHCGFAIKTANHFLILDYWNRGKDPKHPSLTNGHIYPSEIAGENVLVFSTHEHRDHYDTIMFSWHEQIKDLTYILGFVPDDLPEYRENGYQGPEYTYLEPHQHRTFGGVSVTTIEANDAGVGYLIEVDELKIYHAGDHAGWREGERDGFISEIDYLAENVSDIDIAFLNATGCHVQDTIALQESIQYTLEKLNPRYWFPTHAIDGEYSYLNMARKIADAGYKSQATCVENRGDHYIYVGNKIM